MNDDHQEAGELNPFDLTHDLVLESDESAKETFSDRNTCNDSRGQSGTRWT